MRVTEQHTGVELAEELRILVEEDHPDAEVIVLIVDNFSSHKPACLYERFEPEHARRIAQKLEWHYTPEHGSWLNIPECELSVLQRQCLDRQIPVGQLVVNTATNATETPPLHGQDTVQ